MSRGDNNYGLFWLPVIKNLVKFLQEYKDEETEQSPFDDFIQSNKLQFYAGSQGSARCVPCLEVLFDSESKDVQTQTYKGTVNLWLDIYVDKVIANTPEEAYNLIYNMGNAVQKCMIPWQRSLKTTEGLATSTIVTDILSDGDSDSQNYLIRMLLKIDYRYCDFS